MTISVTQSIASSVLGATLALGSSHAMAGPQPDRSLGPVITVQFADLNTSTAEGSRVLYERIRAAAYAVCNGGAHWYPSQYWAQRDCFRSTVDSVTAKLNLPILTALHLANTHRALAPPALQAGIR